MKREWTIRIGTAVAIAFTQTVAIAQTTNAVRRPLDQPLDAPAISPADLAQSTNGMALPPESISSNSIASQVRGQAPTQSGPALAPILSTAHLLNIDFGGPRQKTGPAAIGQSAADFWNPANTLYRSPFYVNGLAWSDGLPSGAALEIDNGTGLWGIGSPDPMYDSYVYSLNGLDVTVTIRSLPSGTYDVYVYGHGPSNNGNSVFELWADGTDFGQEGTTQWGSGWNSTAWEGGQQYIVYRNVVVQTAGTIQIEVRPGASGYVIINGLQIVPSNAISHDPPAVYRLLNVDFGGVPQKLGPAAVGVGASDNWNWYNDTFWGQTNGALKPLVLADGTPTDAGLVITNAPGFWAMTTGDPMYNTYVYPLNWGHSGVILTNLPADGLTADFYLYGHGPDTNANTIFQLTTAGTTYGPRGTTIWGSDWASALWEEGVQYVVFRNVPISANQPVYIDVAPGSSGYADLNGLQIVVPLDRDANGLPDWWEFQYFGRIGVDPGDDPDEDGLTNLEEYHLGLNPVDADTGGTGVRDGDKDTDNDGISNLAELRVYGSCPWNAHTFSQAVDDGLYLFTALGVPKPAPGQPCSCSMLAHLLISYPGGNLVKLEIQNAAPNSIYDLYFLEHIPYDGTSIFSAPWRPIHPGIQCDANGQATVIIEQPTWPQGYFIIFDAADDDGDGLSNGYECWFRYSTGLKSCAQNKYSAGDRIDDGWRVEYGFDPTDPTGQNAEDANPDGDLDPNDGSPLTNYKEYQSYAATDGAFDPLKPYGTGQDRPVLAITAGANPTCETSSFTIGRTGPTGARLTVYYAVGGSLRYGTDYVLYPPPQTSPGDPGDPDGYPRIFVATIPAGDQSVTVQAMLAGHPVTSGQKTLVVALIPYGPATKNPVSDPLSWAYVVDRPDAYYQATITFDFEKLRPIAQAASAQTCPTVPIDIALAGQNACGGSLTFSIVTPPDPTHGTLGPVTQQTPTTAKVTYTPSSIPRFCGVDTFTFKVSDAVGDSAAATVTVNVGNPAPVAICQDVVTPLNTTVDFTLMGSDSPCSEPLTYALTGGPANGTVTLFNPTTGSVTYRPNTGYAGYDSITFNVRNCAFGSQQDQTVNIYVTPLPVLATSCMSGGILLHWSAPWQGLPASFFYDFQIYRCDSTSGSCDPIGPPISVLGTSRSYLDSNDLQPGHTYCYFLTFRHQDQCAPASIYESPQSNTSCNQLCTPPASVLITGNGADGGNGQGPIDTYDFQTEALVRSFVPIFAPNGRGLAIRAGEIYFTEVNRTAPLTDAIHVVPYPSTGTGVADTRTLPNPTASQDGIQDLAFHNNVLYAMTGYGGGQQPRVFMINPTDGTTIGNAVTIYGPASSVSDGFTVLPNGNFLINRGDAVPVYDEYSPTNGLPVAGGLSLNLGAFGFTYASGVAVSPDGQSLYFIVGDRTPVAEQDMTTLLQTDMAGNLMTFQVIGHTFIEDIDVVNR